jgi:hypothetical protein
MPAKAQMPGQRRLRECGRIFVFRIQKWWQRCHSSLIVTMKRTLAHDGGGEKTKMISGLSISCGGAR